MTQVFGPNDKLSDIAQSHSKVIFFLLIINGFPDNIFSEFACGKILS